MASTPGMESRRHWLEASALTSAPSLPLKIIKQIYHRIRNLNEKQFSSVQSDYFHHCPISFLSKILAIRNTILLPIEDTTG